MPLKNGLQPLSKAQQTFLRKLHQKRYRREKGKFLIEGERSVIELLDQGRVELEYIVLQEDLLTSVNERLTNVRCPLYYLEKGVFEQLTDTVSTQGVLAIGAIPTGLSPTFYAESNEGIIMALDGVQDPGNVGTIYRTAAWFGASGILLGTGTADLFSPKTLRSTAGAIGTLPHLETDLIPKLIEAEKQGWSVYLLDADPSAVSLPVLRTTSNVILVVGNEANGISQELIGAGFQKVKIPSPGSNVAVESLNAGIAASIALYHISLGVNHI